LISHFSKAKSRKYVKKLQFLEEEMFHLLLHC